MIDFIIHYTKELVTISLEMAPWLLLGLLFSGMLKVFIPQQWLYKQLGGSTFGAIIRAVLIGIPLPLCSCGVVPTAVGLYKNGASRSATQSFLISTPQTGVDSILATQGLLGWSFALARVLAALVAGLFGGVLSLFSESESSIPRPIHAAEPLQKKNHPIKTLFQYAFIDMLQDIGKWLIYGLLLAALISTIVPQDFFLHHKLNGYTQLLAVLVVSIPLYVCATGSIPIAYTFLLKGLSPGAAFVFLMAGPATNMATVTVLKQVFGKKFLVIYLFSIISVSLSFGLVINELNASFFTVSLTGLIEHQAKFSYIQLISLIFLIILFLYNFIYKKFYPTIKTKTMSDTKKIYVDGMTCNHCKNNVEKQLSGLDNISNVQVDLADKSVSYVGEIDEKIIKETITNLGYTVQN